MTLKCGIKEDQYFTGECHRLNRLSRGFLSITSTTVYYLSLQTKTKPTLVCIFMYASPYMTTLCVGRCVHFKCHFPTWYGQPCTQTEKPRHCVLPYHTEVSKRHFSLHLSETFVHRHSCLLLNKYCGLKVICNIYLKKEKKVTGKLSCCIILISCFVIMTVFTRLNVTIENTICFKRKQVQEEESHCVQKFAKYQTLNVI